jgi:cytochrome c oxidase subunit 2
VAQPPVEFEQWIRAQQQTPPEPAAGLAAKGAKIFQTKTCMNCHAIAGTPARSTVGPDLSHFASRKTILSGMLENNHQNLTRWLSDPPKVKPGAHMPNFLLTPDEVKALAAYLEELK